MPEEDPTDERQDDVEIDDDEVEEANIEADEDVTVEETLEVDDEGVEEEVTITEDGEETASIEEDIPVEVESEEGEEKGEGEERAPLSGTRERIEVEADRAVEGFDERIVDMLSWVLDTETRARIYVHLRQHPYSTSEEVAEGTGLYPSTVREALAELHDEGRLERRKRESEGAGNNPYEYTAIAPSDLVGSIVGQVQDELNAVFNLDRRLGSESEEDVGTETEPVSIRVEDESDDEAGVSDGDTSESDEGDDTS